MKKADLKNRLRRRTADKLYDLDRSTGGVPVVLPAAETPRAGRVPGGRRGRRRGKRPLGRISPR